MEPDTKVDPKESQCATHGSTQNRLIWHHRVVRVINPGLLENDTRVCQSLCFVLAYPTSLE
jgi:hypothetical protein